MSEVFSTEVYSVQRFRQCRGLVSAEVGGVRCLPVRLFRGRELTFDKLFYDEHEYNHFRERDEYVFEKRK